MNKMSYGNLKTISKHIERNEEEVYIEPITICLVNPRQNGNVVIENNIKTCSVQWDYWTTDITGCKFSTTYYADGTIVITPDGIEVEYEDENAFLKGQKVIEKHFEENQNFFKKITFTRKLK